MKSKKFAVFAGLLAGALILQGVPVSAEVHRNEAPNHWRSGEHRKPDHDRDERNFRRDAHHDRRSHHHKPTKRKDFTGVRGAKKELRQDRNKLETARRDVREDWHKR